MPLPKYGYITSSQDLWGPILRHPDGPAEFPVEQVLAYRWYKDCPVRCRFPQLAGVKIVEFPCPEPCNRSFHSPLHLGGHLRVMHGYDRSEILKYGEAMNIDFSKVPGGKAIVEYDQPGYEAAKEIVEDAEYAVETVSAQTPAAESVAATFEEPFLSCADCGYTTQGKTRHEVALLAHRRQNHKEAVPA